MAIGEERDAHDLLQRIARSPRFAGSAAEADARRFCRARLEAAGLTCSESEFEYSQWPARWGPPAAAAAQVVTILIAARTARNGEPLTALAVVVSLLVVFAIVSRNARKRWPLSFPFMRAKAINLVASRGRPTLWLVAHIDSKSQTVPMLYRIGSVVLLNLLTVIAIGALLAQVAGVSAVRPYWLLISLLVGITAVPSMLCLIRNDSPGAVDNASGVAAVLLAVRQLPPEKPVGVLLTSAEELGLAGARAWVARSDASGKVLNCDTVDDVGKWLCMHTGARPNLSSRVATTARELGFNLRARRLIPGILADSVAFSDAGFEAVTISRGSLATLARIHTRRDNSTALASSGVREAAVLLAALTMELG
ncbi:MAG TPA: M28 family peptidase [Gemmatimonadaceae bacterium]|nr:M28 family peptidase [Gemmatimonadaceae bacterium]